MNTIILRRHKLFTTIASIVAFVTVGIAGLANNTQTVAAKTKTIYVQSTKQQNKYIKMASRKGTHYFKGYKVAMQSINDSIVGLDDYGGTGALTYNMNGSINHDYQGSPAYVSMLIGTKTIGSKHYFIAKDNGQKTLVLASDFYVPTCYKLKKGHHLKTYDIPEVENNGVIPDGSETISRTIANVKFEDAGYYTFTKKHPCIRVINAKNTTGRVYYKGEAYRSFDAGTGSYGGWIKEKEIKKDLVKAKGKIGLDSYNGNKIVHIVYDF